MVEAVSDYVTPGFFESVGIRRIYGRDFTGADRQGSPQVAIINHALARLLFPNLNPIGRKILLSQQRSRVFEIVGVVSDVHYYDVRGEANPGVWLTVAPGNGAIMAGKKGPVTWLRNGRFQSADGAWVGVVPSVRA
jgi:hypothetical protein